MLFTGRFLQGLAIGMFLGVGAAFVVDGARPEKRERPPCSPVWASGSGSAWARDSPGCSRSTAPPIHRPFQWHAALMVVGIVAIVAAPETLKRRSGRGLKVRVGVPAGQFRAFATFIAPAGFLMSYLDATLLSLVPLYMVETLGVENLAVVGLVGFLILATGGSTALVFRRDGAAACGHHRGRCVHARLAPRGRRVGCGHRGASDPRRRRDRLHQRADPPGRHDDLQLRRADARAGKLVSALFMCCYAGTVPSVGLGYPPRRSD